MQMRTSWLKLAVAALLSMAACAGFPLLGEGEPQGTGARDGGAALSVDGAQPQAVMEMHEVQYDGKTISGRLLISPKMGSLRLDKRLLSTIDVSVYAVWDCEGKPTEFMMVESVARPAREEDLLILKQGYWYGKTIRLPVFGTYITGAGPACIDADLSLLSFDGRPLGTLRVRAEQRITQTADGGSIESLPPALDGGLP